MRNPIVCELEERILPQLELIAAQLQRAFPKIRIDTWSSSTGSATTDNHAHDLGIDCVFDHAPPHETDNIALFIGVIQIKRDPFLSELAVCWGAGASAECIGTDLLDTPIPWSSEAIARIETALPTLLETLEMALRNPPFPNEPD